MTSAIWNRLVMPGLFRDDIEAIGAGHVPLDAKLRSFIRNRMGYRFVVLPSAVEARAVEATLQSGRWAHGAPLPNPLRFRGC